MSLFKREIGNDFTVNEKLSLKYSLGSLAVAAAGGYVFAEKSELFGMAIAICAYPLSYYAHKVDILNGRNYPHQDYPHRGDDTMDKRPSIE